MTAESRRSSWKNFWVKVIAAFTAINITLCILYFLNYITLYWLIRGFLATLGATFLTYVLQYVKMQVLSEEGRILLYKIAYTIGGASLGIFIILFGVSIILRIMGLPPLPKVIGTWPAVILLLIIAPSIGGYLGYRIGKKRKFQPLNIP